MWIPDGIPDHREVADGVQIKDKSISIFPLNWWLKGIRRGSFPGGKPRQNRSTFLLRVQRTSRLAVIELSATREAVA